MPPAELALVMDGGVGLMVKVKAAEPVPPALVALKVILEVPAVVGVPEIKPEVVSIFNPAGRPEASKPVGLLVAVI